MKFEYKIIRPDLNVEGKSFDERIEEITEELNKLGAEGWEAVNGLPVFGPYLFVLLKRQRGASGTY